MRGVVGSKDHWGRSSYFRQITTADKDSQTFEWDYFDVLAQTGGIW